MRARAAAVPGIAAALSFALVSPSVSVTAIVLIAAFTGWLAAGRVAIGRIAQLIALGLFVAVGGTFLRPLLPPLSVRVVGQLHTGWATVAALALLIGATASMVAKPIGGRLTPTAFALLGFGATGGTESGWRFPLLVVVFFAVAAWARRRAEGSDRGVLKLSRRDYGTLAGLVTAAVAATAVAAVALPSAHEWAMSRIMRMGPRAQTGFSNRMWLGSMNGMLTNDQLVIRVTGEPTDYLRGVAYTRYGAGRWTHDAPSVPIRDIDRTLVDQPKQTTLAFLDEPERYFIPLEARDVAVPTAEALATPLGTLEPVAASTSQELSFTMGPRRRFAPVRPTAADLTVPRALRETLNRLIVQITSRERTPAERLADIEAFLKRNYRYSLTVDRPGHGDPLIHFLEQDRRGYCEYFASALALLGRAAGIPTRVIGGYRVSEFNSVGGYYMVRQNDAHSWVEAWLPGQGWTTADATPSSGELVAKTPLAAALADATRVLIVRGLRYLDGLSTLQIAFPLLILIPLYLAVRLYRARRERLGLDSGDAQALESFIILSRTLEKHGMARERSETISAFAERVRASDFPGPLANQIGEHLSWYTRLRYGNGDDDESAFSQRTAELCSALAAARRQ